MSTWTCDVIRPPNGRGLRGVWPVLCLPLAACLDLAGAPSQTDTPRAVAFYDGAVTVTGPRGYCIDPDSVKREVGGRFALLASCESLTGQVGIAVDPAVMTVSVLPRAAQAAPPDASAMARAVGPDTVRRAEESDDLTLVHVAEGGETVLPGGDPAYWRATLVINGHIVGLAAYGPRDGAIAGPRGRDLLGDLAATLRAASPPRGANDRG